MCPPVTSPSAFLPSPGLPAPSQESAESNGGFEVWFIGRTGPRRRRSRPPLRRQLALAAVGKQRDFLASSIGNLSGGECQMVALIRALLIEPRLLLLDEPSAVLDPRTTAQLEELVGLWFRQGRADRAYIWVSHDASQADRVGDRSSRLQEGRLAENP